MNDPRDFWNARYASVAWAYGTEPNDFVRAHFEALTTPVLCLGEGEGRNAVFLAQQGLDVTAVDLSAVAIEKAQKLAKERGVTLTAQVADLESYELGEARWGGIVSVWCHLPSALRRRVHAACVKALKPGGALLLEAYTPRQLALDTGGPKNADMLMEPDHLRAELAGLTFELLEEKQREVHEGDWHAGTSAVVQLLARKP